MVLSLILTGVFIYLESRSQSGQLGRAMQATAASMEQAAVVTEKARDYYTQSSQGLKEAGEAMVALGPLLVSMGEQTHEMGKFMGGLSLPDGITMNGLKPQLTYTQPLANNRLLGLGEDFTKVGNALNHTGPSLKRMAEEAPVIQKNLEEITVQLKVAATELRTPVQGRSGLLILGIVAGLLLFTQSLCLWLLAGRLEKQGGV